VNESQELISLRAAFFHWMNESYRLAVMAGEEGIKTWVASMEKSLISGYKQAGAKENSGIEAFIDFVGKRDRLLGLKVDFEMHEDGFTYKFFQCPFLRLKNIKVLSQGKLIEITDCPREAFLKAKTKFFCPDYEFTIKQSQWHGAPHCEYVFKKKKV
jgi:hypothetical protein